MRGLEHLLVEVAEAIAPEAGSPGEGMVVAVREAALDLPVETEIGRGGVLASMPRGALATGFALAAGRMRLSLVLEAAP